LGPVIYPGVAAAVFHDKFSNVLFVELLLVALALVGVLRFSRPWALAACLLVLAGIDSGTHATHQTFMWSLPTPPGFQHFRNNRVTTFDPATALAARVDSTAPTIYTDIPANDGFINKKFYLGAYSPFLLNRFATLLARDFRHFLITGKRVVGFIGEPPPTDALAFLQQQVPVTFQILRYLPDRVDYVVFATAPTTLVFNEMYYPGWKARIDHGKSLRMLEVSGGLRGLTVGPGHHVIETRYSPSAFWFGLFTTLASWLFALAWLLRTTVWLGKSRREQPASA